MTKRERMIALGLVKRSDFGALGPARSTLSGAQTVRFGEALKAIGGAEQQAWDKREPANDTAE
jgi:hypothetical protein